MYSQGVNGLGSMGENGDWAGETDNPAGGTSIFGGWGGSTGTPINVTYDNTTTMGQGTGTGVKSVGPNWWEQLTANLLTTGVNTASKVAIISSVPAGTVVNPNGGIIRYPEGTSPSVFSQLGIGQGSTGLSGNTLMLILLAGGLLLLTRR